ncbi:hypothetical protein PAMP_020268 [Pampus punctatissimus]
MCEASGNATGRHEDQFTSDHTWRRRASGPGLMEGLRYLLRVCLEPLQPLKTQRGELDMKFWRLPDKVEGLRRTTASLWTSFNKSLHLNNKRPCSSESSK